MKRLTRFLPTVALLAGAALAQHAAAATALNVNCTFTISKDVHIVWTGTGAVASAITTAGGNTADLTWAIGTATLGTSYSTIGTGDGWVAATSDTLKITNNSLTGDGVVLALTPSSTGWTAGSSAGANQFVAACTANNTPPANTAAVFTAGTLTSGANAFVANLAATSSTAALWFAITVPSSITQGGGAKTVVFAFTGTAF